MESANTPRGYQNDVVDFLGPQAVYQDVYTPNEIIDTLSPYIVRQEGCGRVQRTFAMHQTTLDEEATCASMVAREPTARLTLMPTHHVGEFGDLTGFRYDMQIF
jgi:hypothetical protein